ADVPFLDQVKELQPAVGVLFGDRDDQAQVGFNEFALGGFSVNVPLDDLALRAPELLVGNAGISLLLFQLELVLALDAAVLALGLFNAGGVNLLLQVVDLAIELAHGIDALVHAIDEALALRIGELEVANAD